ncbi:leucyl aminopeptidase family protein [Devosia sp. 63-57]|uniref:leucyl aminopeptidase family protein n=1 Tax=Devosia sp. 63-57 TaxID=1895751 RepID=UPI00086EA640|nr:leucyl aminopeptidase family protein [Devosia sp. 63-57]ODT47710.1 MAG: leucyl aminopeptidase [Pelagibacterium sp. SCN 63-126]ODU88234.1 MAG: leucyl aminopeptidase [Pelagibacterium sp. SCN 63-17]OJX42582.1 MAG: leucyl aminopeptidase [Devosia sp. 63-57]
MSISAPLPLICVAENGLDAAGLDPVQRAWADQHGFAGQRGKLLAVPGTQGAIGAWLFGMGGDARRNPLLTGLAAAGLPEGHYTLAGAFGDPTLAAIGFRLGAYRFDRYREAKPVPTIALPEGADADEVERQVVAATLARDLINTPANDLGPDALEQVARDFAASRGMAISVTSGDDLLAQNFPLIHAVGRASAQAPRLVDLTWGDPSHPKVTLVGKGVTFDTGGLDIKSAAGMLMMKKDMGGAANILGLAHTVVSAGLPVRLRVLLPIVENAIAGSAFRPGDVIRSRKGLTVEIGNTDAEGRLILADALALADEEAPELLVDMATLTGAARVALGPELPPVYATDDAIARDLAALGLAAEDPLWPMPLWAPYDGQLSSKIADINNTGSGGYAGSVTAALFLKRFVAEAKAWVHLDIFGWAPEARPGRPVGATDQGIRAVYGLLRQRYGA